MRHVFLYLLIVALSPLMLLGQGTSATVSGAVTDPSGSVVPNAKVTATNTATGAATSANSNGSGFYVISSLQPGPYRLDVAVPGFQTYEQTGIVLQVGAEVSVNVSLKLGAATEKVVVTGAAPLVDTRDQTVSVAVTPRLTEQLPLNGRNLLQLLSLAPDSSEHPYQAKGGFSGTGGYAYPLQRASRPEAQEGLVSASGSARENSTAFYLDGGLNMDTYTPVANVFPNPDAVQEFTFDTSAYSAKYGGLGGGVVSAVTRGGTNQFHGTAFEYVRNGVLNGRNFFAADQDTLKRNQFGFSLGAPIQKDKTFAFFSFQRTTLRYGTTANVAFGPTAAERAGDWSALLKGDHPIQLYNNVLTRDANGLPLAFTTNHSLATPFSGNHVPVSYYVPVALKLLALVPAGDPSTGRITYESQSLANDNQFVGRVDRNFGDKLRISGTFLRDVYPNPQLVDPNNMLTAGADSKWLSTHGALNATYSFGRSLVTTVGATLSRAVIINAGTHAFPSTIGLGANFPNWLPSGQTESAIGGVNNGWYGGNTINDHYRANRDQLDFTNNWTYMRGNHTLEFGGEYTISSSILNQDFEGQGDTSATCAYSGYSPLDFMMGQNCYYEQFGPLYDAARGKIPAIYVNDKWRVKGGLTFNLGLRWEPWAMWPDQSATGVGMVVNEAAFAARTHSTRYPNLPPGFLVRGDPGVPNTLVPSDWKLFDPRVGLAWDVRGDGKTSIRAGVGMYHDQPYGIWYNQMLSSFPFVSSYVITDPTVPWYSPYNSSPYNGALPPLQAPPPKNTVFPLPLSYAIGFSPDFKSQGTLQWNLTAERQLGQGFLLRGAYEASESWHMPGTRDVNSAVFIPGNNPDGTAKSTSDNTSQRRPWYPYYGGQVMVDESAKTSSYNALSISVEKRMPGNLSVLGGYRWSKCLDEATDVSTHNDENVDDRNRMLDYGLCTGDIGSQLKLAVVYNLPSLRSWGFAGRNIIGGWTMSGIWNWRDGFPFTVNASVDSNLNGSFNDRADVVGNPTLPGGRSRAARLNEWFNTAAFQNPVPGTNGNSARDFLRAPGYFNVDYTLTKSFPIRYGPLKEAQRIDFRAEFFNIFNHPNFLYPDNSIGDQQFGQILSARDPRIIQFALKYIF